MWGSSRILIINDGAINSDKMCTLRIKLKLLELLIIAVLFIFHTLSLFQVHIKIFRALLNLWQVQYFFNLKKDGNLAIKLFAIFLMDFCKHLKSYFSNGR